MVNKACLFGSPLSSLLELNDMAGAPQITVPTVTIDGYCSARRLCPDFIKIDAEGAEPMILAGARATVGRYRPVLVFEIWTAHWPRYREVVNWLAADYDMTRLSDGALVPAAYLGPTGYQVADILAVPRTVSGTDPRRPAKLWRYRVWRFRLRNWLDWQRRRFHKLIC